MFKNMKIEINEAQPLDEVVIEIERLGYGLDTESIAGTTVILTWDFGSYDKVNTVGWDRFDDVFGEDWKKTTLAELKEMQCKI